jgi:hypothetical protein
MAAMLTERRLCGQQRCARPAGLQQLHQPVQTVSLTIKPSDKPNLFPYDGYWKHHYLEFLWTIHLRALESIFIRCI